MSRDLDRDTRVITDHQRMDAGSCVCGWGVNTGDLGRSHSEHVARELAEAERRDQLANAVDDALGDAEPPHWCQDSESAYLIALGRSAATGTRWSARYSHEHERWFAAPVGA